MNLITQCGLPGLVLVHLAPLLVYAVCVPSAGPSVWQ